MKKQITFLVVDDEELITEVLQQALKYFSKTHAVTVHTAHCVSDAHDILMQIPVDIVITDWNIGRECGAMVLKDAVGVQVHRPKLVVMTGDPTNDVRGVSGSAQPDLILYKPFDVIDFLSKISGIVEIEMAQVA